MAPETETLDCSLEELQLDRESETSIIESVFARNAPMQLSTGIKCLR